MKFDITERDQRAEVRTVIGLTSGPTLDGVGAAILRTDGETLAARGSSATYPFSRALKTFIRRAVKAVNEGRREAQDVADAGRAVTSAHADAASRLVEANGLAMADVDLIGFEGHEFPRSSTANGAARASLHRLGDPVALARSTGVPVVAEFAAADVAAGGAGRPLEPAYHAAIAKGLDLEGPVAILTIGAVASVTFAPRGGRVDGLVAFDCGPGDGLLEEWMLEKTGAPVDRAGKAARGGIVDDGILRLLLRNPYLRHAPPKLLDLRDFRLGLVRDLSLLDGAATLTAFTAAAVAAAVPQLPEPPAAWIVCGRGRRNPALMEALRARLPGAVSSAEDFGWRGDHVAAECIAYLAVRSVRGLPMTFPGTTGAPSPLGGGRRFAAWGASGGPGPRCA